MNPWFGPTAVAALVLLAACTSTTSGTNTMSDQLAALDACRGEADATRNQPEGRGLTGAQDYDRFVAECMRSKGFPLQP